MFTYFTGIDDMDTEPAPTTTSTVAALEQEAAKERPKTYHVSEPTMLFCVQMLDKHGSDFAVSSCVIHTI